MRRSLDKKSPAGDAGLLLFIDGRELPAECHFDRREKSCPTVREKISRRKRLEMTGAVPIQLASTAVCKVI